MVTAWVDTSATCPGLAGAVKVTWLVCVGVTATLPTVPTPACVPVRKLVPNSVTAPPVAAARQETLSPVVVGVAMTKNGRALLVAPVLLVTLTETWPEHGAVLGTTKVTWVAVTVVGVTAVDPKFTLVVVAMAVPLIWTVSPGLPWLVPVVVSTS